MFLVVLVCLLDFRTIPFTIDVCRAKEQYCSFVRQKNEDYEKMKIMKNEDISS